MKKVVIAMVVACVAVGAMASERTEESRVQMAESLFEDYVRLEHAYDPALADLYDDAAVIKNTRRYPTGQVREFEFPAAGYKALIRQLMPLAKASGDRSTYSGVKFELNSDGSVSIEASRYSELKDYTSPLKLTVAPDEKGEWRIIEELSESQP